MTNRSQGDYAYTLLDLDSELTPETVQKLKNVSGMIRVRKIK